MCALPIWVQTEVFRLMNANGVANANINTIQIKPQQLGDLIVLVETGAINNNTAREVFEEMFKTGQDAKTIVDAKGLGQISDTSALQKIIEDVIAANATQVQQDLGGNEKLFGFFVGQAMKATKGKGNAGLINQMLKEAIEKQKS